MSETQQTEQSATAVEAAPAAPNDYVSMEKSVFHFKTDKDTEVKNDAGEVVTTIKGKKHPSVSIFLPVPKPSKLVEYLSDTTDKYAKERELLMSAVSSIVFSITRSQINDFREKSPEVEVTPGVIDYDKLDFTAIANLPKSERGSYVPPEEDIKKFLASYMEVMPAAANRDAEKIKNHVDIIATGFKKQRAQKDMLEAFQDFLAVYASSVSPDVLDEHGEVVEYYLNKLARLLKVEEKITMDDL